ncbi:PREDICTED: uncharacterized protein LOC108367534 [Rhagoletis zephyria]|uniref:uncharacterized protein LOC108367534 n=1 Tax=Rhagoletis zephyria TaxID=28612 RepID=UPI00081141A9|nr:PREDICTED: uncharacterized protein LOC108367534 [Rhagoletis zephyria]
MPNNATMPPASPIAQRRDSILKHQNSVKTDKRVSIKPGSQKSSGNKLQMTSNLEYISEKASSLSSSASTLPSSGSTTLERRPSKTTTGPRPASLVITKNDNKGSQFKLVRSSSVDYEDIESQVPTRTANKIILAEHLQEDESAPLVFTVHK